MTYQIRSRKGKIINNLAKCRVVILLVVVMLLLSYLPALAETNLTNLRCEYLKNPLGLDILKPRLSWVIESDKRGWIQSAYQILVASSPEFLAQNNGDVWNSGKVESEQSNQLEYSGKALQSHKKYYWKVKVWDNDGKSSPWSSIAYWVTGMLSDEDWKADWITWQPTLPDGSKPDTYGDVSPWLRKTFNLAEELTEAFAYVNVVGYFELYVNGKKVGNDVLSPAVSDYAGRSFYITYDIKSYLQRGNNCIALWLGRGWYHPEAGYRDTTRGSGPRARVQVELMTNDQNLKVVSDETWKAASSPYTTLGIWQNNQYHGELYDARMENKEWNLASFDESKWENARVVSSPSPRTEAQLCPVNRVGKRIIAHKITDLGQGRYEIDFGTNISGGFRFNFPLLRRGDTIIFHFADGKVNTLDIAIPRTGSYKELVFKDNDGNINAYQSFRQYDKYIASGLTNETFETKFNYHGYRYVVVDNLPAPPEKNDAEATLIESDLETAGSFSCSNDLFNRIRDVNLWTIRCLNLGGQIVDCPHRERKGYGADGQVPIETHIMNFDVSSFYPKWAQDWIDVQVENFDCPGCYYTGNLPNTAPHRSGGGGPAWGGILQAITWRMYLYYGDRRILENNYDACLKYLESLEANVENGILRSADPDSDGKLTDWAFLGDWVPPGRGMDALPTNWPSVLENELFNNCYRVYLWEQLARMAAILNRNDDERYILSILPEMRSDVHKAFYNEKQQMYVKDKQTYYVVPLIAGVVPDNLRNTVIKRLEDNILIKSKGHLNTGLLGTYFLIQYLQEIGRNDLIFSAMSKKTYPSWGYMLENGATTFWEQWNGYYSLIHACFTSAASWFHQGLAGINIDESVPGFKKVIIKPSLVGDITWVKAKHNSAYGEIESSWELKDGKVFMNVTIPPNTIGKIYIPTTDASTITENGKLIDNYRDVKFIEIKNEYSVYEVGSGSYKFAAVN